MESPPFDRRAWPAQAVAGTWKGRDGWPHRVMRLRYAGAGVPPRGNLLFLGGRADMIEKYLEPIEHWARRGWSVVAFDWRGQGGSGRLLGGSNAGHIEDFGIWVDDLAAFWEDWVAEGGAGPHVAVAHSMGGHLLMRAMTERRVAPDRAVLLSPMLGINAGSLSPPAAEAIARVACALGFSRRALWRENVRSPRRQARLSHDADRIADELYWLDSGSGLAVGPPTWKWVAQAYRSMRLLEHNPDLDRMAIPTLILAATADQLVSVDATRRIAARLPGAEAHFYGPEAAHEILREADGVRRDALARIDAFLERAA